MDFLCNKNSLFLNDVQIMKKKLAVLQHRAYENNLQSTLFIRERGLAEWKIIENIGKGV